MIKVMEFRPQLQRLIDGDDLDAASVAQTIGSMMDGDLSLERAAAWLVALAAKGENVDEVVGAAEAMRHRALRVEHRERRILDVCGTGGDGHNTINISTAVAFIVSSFGVAVAKHGNRSASSLCGSADVLEALGVQIDRSPDEAREALERGEVAFLFAQRFHPAMRAVAGLRRELGVRTVFNLLGPLTNPAIATHQLIGVAAPRSLEIVAEAAQRLGVRSGAVIHAANGLDEIAGDAITTMVQFDKHGTRMLHIDPRLYGIACPLSELRGGDARENAAALLAILEGERSPRADVVALNAAVALVIAEVAESIEEGLELAQRSLRDQSARHALSRVQTNPKAEAVPA
jgi:anthranilate phosphoribosyltransferase